ncbi:MAG: Jag N-terminal domain-containing protein [Syntrophales bacterium]|nr:Jag N-terminal domain-containing protein [Syntrophales bacterium]MDD5642533.1 Jag N-terminal domain-containing protein [Syntrophales bacterium]
MEFVEFEGKSTEEAIESACSHFQVSPEQLEIEILSVGSSGLFGLGGRKAKIRAVLREEAPASLLPQAQEILEQLLENMDESGKVTGSQEDDRIILNIETEDAGLLIGKQGQTLEAMQYLITKILAKKSRRKVRITIDVESYRARHNEALVQLALKNGDKVKRTGKSVTLNPMNPHDRRIVHLTLQADKELKTMSRGEGLYKKVIIYPAKKRESQEDTSDRS